MIKIDIDTLSTWGHEYVKSTAFSVKNDTQCVLQATRDTEVAHHLFGTHRVVLEMVNSTNPPFTAYSGEAGQRFHAKLDTHSRGSWAVGA